MPIRARLQSQLITNRGPNTLQLRLTAGLRQAQRADLAVAFVSVAGLQHVLTRLSQVASRGEVRIVVGLYQDITEPEALRKLFRFSNEYGKTFSVRIARNRKFHTKLYLLTSKTKVTALIGSSNLSSDGLLSDGELVMCFTITPSADIAKHLSEQFEAIWMQETVPLTLGLIQRYSARHALLRKHGKPRGLPPLVDILQDRKESAGAGDDGESTPPLAPPRWWRDSIGGLVRPPTEIIVAEETNWNAKGWDWCCPGPNSYKRNDLLLILDFVDKMARIAKITDRAECRSFAVGG
jgi:HKD family nuclease